MHYCDCKGTIKLQLLQRVFQRMLTFLYSIPTLNGSSGSPILNKDGKVVGVHHAGYALKQGFNSGIYSKWLKKLLRSLGI